MAPPAEAAAMTSSSTPTVTRTSTRKAVRPATAGAETTTTTTTATTTTAAPTVEATSHVNGTAHKQPAARTRTWNAFFRDLLSERGQWSAWALGDWRKRGAEQRVRATRIIEGRDDASSHG